VQEGALTLFALMLPTLQDFIPPEELAKLAAKSGDKAAAEALEKKNAIGEPQVLQLVKLIIPRNSDGVHPVATFHPLQLLTRLSFKLGICT